MRHHCSCTERCNKRHYNNVAEGQSPSTNLQGDIEFRGVHFSYPSRSEVSVFNGLDLVVPSGSVTAVVGASGSGKSTLPALLMRFYDPSSGVLQIDGTSVRDFSPQWLRSHISIVHQVPAQWPWFYLIFLYSFSLLIIYIHCYFHNDRDGTKWPFMCWCAFKKLLAHSHQVPAFCSLLIYCSELINLYALLRYYLCVFVDWLYLLRLSRRKCFQACLSVCLSVNKITLKVVDEYSWIFWES